jgi:hypothetical protein
MVALDRGFWLFFDVISQSKNKSHENNLKELRNSYCNISGAFILFFLLDFQLMKAIFSKSVRLFTSAAV